MSRRDVVPAENPFHPQWGWFVILVGLIPTSVALGWLPAGDGLHAPKWVIGICGGVFIAFGLALLLKTGDAGKAFLAGLICLGLSAVGLSASFAPADSIQGGIPFLPKALNVKIGRFVFAGGSLLGFFIATLALHDGFRKLRKTD